MLSTSGDAAPARRKAWHEAITFDTAIEAFAVSTHWMRQCDGVSLDGMAWVSWSASDAAVRKVILSQGEHQR
jgi:hypothetical protein